MKVLLADYVVHTVHDTEFEVAGAVAEGKHQGKVGTVRLKGLIVEATADGEPTITFKVVTDGPEDHDAALKKFGFGAPVEFEARALGEGMTPHERMMNALPFHVAEAETRLPMLEAAFAALPDDLDPNLRQIEKDRLEDHRRAITHHTDRLHKHFGPEKAAELLTVARA